MARLSKFYRRVPGFRRVKRAWRSRGFGIHSPFAFRFVTAVLRERGEYYGYQELRKSCPGKREFRKASLLFRLVCEFIPDTVILDPELGQSMQSAVRIADSRACVLAPSAIDVAFPLPERTMLVCSSSFISRICDGASRESEIISAVMVNGGTVVVFGLDRKDFPVIKSLMKDGMTFTDRHTYIFVNRQDLPRQDFEINF